MKFFIILLVAGLSLVLFGCVQTPPTPIPNSSSNVSAFCGWSTNGTCGSDSDCRTGGCSGQVCQSRNESQIFTTCEWRECYNAVAAGVKCKCTDRKCQWIG